MATARQHDHEGPPPAAEARFVVIEGMDGAGTTTISAMLADALRARDLRVRLTAEPSQGAFGRLLRRHVLGETTLESTTAALMFTADRADHVDRELAPALARGDWVVCDRYLLSTLAYQGLEVDRAAIMAASSSFPVPGITFLLEAPADVRRARIATRGRIDRYEDPDLSEPLHASYHQAMALLRAAGHRVEVIDAARQAGEVLADVIGRLEASAGGLSSGP